MDLVNARILTDDVAALSGFYATLLNVTAVTNDYYVELPTRTAVVALCRRRFTEADGCGVPSPCTASDRVILDFEVDDVDSHHRRLQRLGIGWIMAPTTQPWGNRSAIFRDPEGNLVNLFARTTTEP